MQKEGTAEFIVNTQSIGNFRIHGVLTGVLTDNINYTIPEFFKVSKWIMLDPNLCAILI
jgi:hypothetical protein